MSAFDRLFAQGPARENFFLQLCFFGELVYRDGLPAECDPLLFERAKTSLGRTQIRYLRGDAVTGLGSLEPPADFVSFSDVPSYFKGELEREFMQRIRPGIAPGARIVIRNYVHAPEETNLGGYRETTREFGHEIAAEKLQMYDVRVYEAVTP